MYHGFSALNRENETNSECLWRNYEEWNKQVARTRAGLSAFHAVKPIGIQCAERKIAVIQLSHVRNCSTARNFICFCLIITDWNKYNIFKL
jgi:hypothetical protein